MTLTAVVRTVIAAIITYLTTLGPVQAAVDWLNSIGIPISWDDIGAWLTIATLGAVTALLNWAGRRWPVIAQIVSLGRSNQSANY